VYFPQEALRRDYSPQPKGRDHESHGSILPVIFITGHGLNLTPQVS